MLWTNRAAADIIAQADGLAVMNGRISAAVRAENTDLQALVRAAIATNGYVAPIRGSSMRVSRPSSARPLTIAPLQIVNAIVRGPAAVVFAIDPERKSEPAPDLLRRLYGFTKHEALLADLLLQGADLREAAEKLGVSMNTVRTHLRVIFGKTDTRRQAELVRVLLRGPAGLL